MGRRAFFFLSEKVGVAKLYRRGVSRLVSHACMSTCLLREVDREIDAMERSPDRFVVIQLGEEGRQAEMPYLRTCTLRRTSGTDGMKGYQCFL